MYFTETRADYHQDFDELHYLLSDSVNRLKRFLSDIRKVKKHIAMATYEEMSATANRYIEACRGQDSVVMEFNHTLNHTNNEESLLEAGKIKRSAYEFLRVHQTLFAALISSTDWQSPSFDHTLISRAGRQTNTIYATINDYKRDQHWDAHAYERAFINEYIDNWIKFPINAYVTSSGMAAFATILNFLLLEKKTTGPILMGASVWFQNKFLLQNAFKKQIISIDQKDTATIVKTIITQRPTILFFDSLENSPEVTLPDLGVILTTLVKHATQETYLVIDNTCLTVFLQPLLHLFGKRSKVRLIVFESLNKYHQFGMDRTTGGIIWSYGGDTLKLFDYRVHLGTNMPDSAVLSLPTPSRTHLTKRLLRHNRNTGLLALALHGWIQEHPKSPFSRIVYPSLSHHASYVWAGHNPFQGSFFVIEFKKPYQTIRTYKHFVSLVMKKARNDKVDLTSSTSFGFDQTRIYLTAVRSTSYKPFIRVAVGTETRQAIEALTSVFIESFSHFK